MNTIEQIVTNESLDDIVTVFALAKPNPHLDMMIRRYSREVLKYGELEKSYTRLFEQGVLVKGENGLSNKGPNWKPPQFVLEKRYAE